MNYIKKTMICVLALVLALLSPAQAFSLFGSGVASSDIQDDGVVRVYLKSLGMPRNLTLTLDGEYTVENDPGFRFKRGAQIVLSDGGDTVYLTAGGLTIDMGAGLTLTRQRSDAEPNGMRIAETGRDTLYCGDLAVSLEDNGGLRAVLSVNMEDYLLGVVAYEMSDSWPVEALKAQAVAARTYAMQRKWSAGARDYDLVDTTGDQVFKGYNPKHANVAAAVQDTSGVVGTYKGGFATCYYTASNGGQTAMPQDVWAGSGDFGYLERTGDPYDLENPDSLVTSVSFGADAADLPALREMLENGLRAAAKEQGYVPENVQLGEILSIAPVNPAAEGSLMYKTLRFTLSAMEKRQAYVRAEGASLPGGSYVKQERLVSLPLDYTVDLDVFTDIKDGLGLSLNGGDYEVVSALRGGDGRFAIEMRRYGHGVGMSQRGAQTMAGSHGKTWREILKFYYPGMTLEKIDWNTPELQSIDELPEGVGAARPDPTPKPTPAPLPALQDGESYARAALSDASSSLNVRREPTTMSPVVTQISNGHRLIVTGEPDAEGWVPVKTVEFSGYVKMEYLKQE